MNSSDEILENKVIEEKEKIETDRRLRQADQYYKAVIQVMHEALKSGMWSMEFDEQGKMTSVYWSDEFRHMMGFDNLEDFPNTLEAWSDRLHKEDYDFVIKEFRDTIADYTNQKSYDVVYRCQLKSGEWRWFHAMGRLLRREDGTPMTYVGMFVDVTEDKEKEQKLQEALEKAEAANKAKSVFLSHMSHDIRTPINGIMGMTSIALRHLDDVERTRDCLEKIDDASEHLLMLINDVLDMSRIEAGKLQLNHAAFDLKATIANCASIIKGQIQTPNIRFNYDYSAIRHGRVIGDELHLREVFINILGNSVKFTNEGDEIRFYAKELRSENGRGYYHFELEDTGIGMSEDFLPKLFEAFTQEGDDSRTNYTGTGLGMAITKQMVELLGGTIQVESQLNVGTKFTIELPLEIDTQEEEVLQEEPKAADLTGVKILVAEDNEINMEIVKVLLEEAGVIVTPVFDGQEAVDTFAAAKEGTFDAILMDVMMPVMDGLEASRRIRTLDRPDAKTIPIIAATANVYEEDIRKTREAGMNAHVGKPLDINALTFILQRYVKGAASN